MKSICEIEVDLVPERHPFQMGFITINEDVSTLCYSLIGVLPLIVVLIHIWARSVSYSLYYSRSDP